MSPRFFESSTEFRQWLQQNHTSAPDLLLGFYKKDSGKGGLTYPEALDEALCFGWIDGVRKSRDSLSYTIRFTPRKPGSIWSQVNVRHAERLIRENRMQSAGQKAFSARTAKRTGVYSFENKPQRFPAALEARFRSQTEAWSFWNAQPPGYRRIVMWWVLSAKQEATTDRRFAQVIADSAAQRRVDLLSPFRKAK